MHVVKSWFVAFVVVLVVSFSAEPAEAQGLFFRDDATGGDCTSVGIWNAATKTCTLTQDVFTDFFRDRERRHYA